MDDDAKLCRFMIKQAQDNLNKYKPSTNDNQSWNGKERRKSRRLEMFNWQIFNYCACDSQTTRGSK